MFTPFCFPLHHLTINIRETDYWNSLPFTGVLNKQGVGVQRAGAIRVPYLADDQGHYRQAPSFDFNVTFTRTLRPETGVVSALFPDIYCI